MSTALAMLRPWLALGAGRVLAHLAGPASPFSRRDDFEISLSHGQVNSVKNKKTHGPSSNRIAPRHRRLCKNSAKGISRNRRMDQQTTRSETNSPASHPPPRRKIDRRRKQNQALNYHASVVSCGSILGMASQPKMMRPCSLRSMSATKKTACCLTPPSADPGTPQMSFRFTARLRRRSAVISSDHSTTRHGARRVPFAPSPLRYRIAYQSGQLSTSIPRENPNAATPDATVSGGR
jgi:hypothetical protein